jgi:hypothetical protein
MFETLERRQYLSTVTIDASSTADQQSSLPYLLANHAGPLSLRDALTLAQIDASQGQTVVVQLGQQLTYAPSALPENENGQPTLGQAGSLTVGSITIQGNGSTINLSADHGQQLLSVGGSANVTLDNLTIANGSSLVHGPVTVGGSANLTVNSVTFSNDTTFGGTGGGAALTDGDYAGGDGSGGAVYIGTTGTVNFNEDTFTNDSATGGTGTTTGTYGAQGGNGLGGAVAIGDNADATVVFTNSTFTGNTVHGGLTASTGNGFDPNDKTSFAGFDPNSSYFQYGSAEGGAVYAGTGDAVRFNGATMSQNQAIGRTGWYGFAQGADNGEDGGQALGGAVYAINANVTFNNGEVVSNAATGGTGGNANHTSNQAGKGGAAFGGGLYLTSSALNITGTLIGQNAVTGGLTGGTKSGVTVNNGTGSVIYTNSTDYAAAGGGGIYFGAFASATLTNATVSGNTATGHAGEGTTFNDDNGEDGGNAYGGGIYLDIAGGYTFTLAGGSTVSGNTAIGGLGGISNNNNYDLTGCGGNAEGGGIYVLQGSLVANSANLLGNTAQAGTTAGGQYGIVSTDQSNGPVVDPNRTSVAQGGGIYLYAGYLSITSGVIQANDAVGSNAPVYTNSYVSTGRTGGLAQGGGLYLNHPASTVNLTSVSITGNDAVGGTGSYATGGTPAGGNGGSASGGAVYLASGSATIATSLLGRNGAFGGEGGQADYSGQAGSNGNAQGGGISANGSLTLNFDIIDGNQAWGGAKNELTATAGGIESNGGNGGSAWGGGVYQTAGTLTADFSVWSFNEAFGGNGGAGYNGTSNADSDGISGGYGGNGGSAYGGGVYAGSGVSFAVQNSSFRENMVLGGLGGLGGNGGGQEDDFSNNGGDGGAGGAGGSGYGGGVAIYDIVNSVTANLDSASFVSSRFIENQVGAGDGGNGGNSGFGDCGNVDGGSLYNTNYTGGDGGQAGAGGAGGDAAGGALWNEGAAVYLSQDAISSNGATSGWGGDGGIGGFGGNGQYNEFAGFLEHNDYGGNGGNGGAGGKGGFAYGGGVAVVDGTASVYSTSVLNNTVVAGYGGDGGEGGVAGYGASNGAGGIGGTGGNGGNGGNAEGGGVYSGADPRLLAIAPLIFYTGPLAGAVHLVNATVSGNSVASGGHGSSGVAAPTTSASADQVYASSRAALVAGEVLNTAFESGGAQGVVALETSPAILLQGWFKTLRERNLRRPAKMINFDGDPPSNQVANVTQSSADAEASGGSVGELEAETTAAELSVEEDAATTIGTNLLASDSTVDFAGPGLVDDLVNFADTVTQTVTEFAATSVNDALAAANLAGRAAALVAQTTIEVASILAESLPEVLAGYAAGIAGELLGPETIVFAAPAIAEGVFFGVVGVSAGIAGLIAEVNGSNPTDAVESMLDFWLQPGAVKGVQYDVGKFFTYDSSDGVPTPGSVGTNGVDGSNGAALGGGIYVEPAVTINVNGSNEQVAPVGSVANTIVAGNTATNQQLNINVFQTQRLYTSDPANPADKFNNINVATNGDVFSSSPLYPLLNVTNTADNTDADVSGVVTTNGHNLIGIGGSQTWASSDQAGTAAQALNPHLVVIQSDVEDDTIPLAEVGGAATIGTGNVSALPGDFNVNADQIGSPRIGIGGAPSLLDIGAVQYTGGPVIAAAGDVTTLPTTVPQVVTNFATVLAYSPSDTSASPAVTYSVTDDSNAALFSVAPVVSADGTLTYTLANGVVGTSTITLVASDNGINSLPVVFRITSAQDSTITVTSNQPAGTVPTGQAVEYDVAVNAAQTTGALAADTQVKVTVVMPAGFQMSTATGTGWTVNVDPNDPTDLIALYSVGSSALPVGTVLPTLTISGTFTTATALPFLDAEDNLPGEGQLNFAANTVSPGVAATALLNVGQNGTDILDPAATDTVTESSTDVLPAGVSYNPATRSLTGTPARGTGGAYTLHFNVTPAGGSTSTDVLTLYVDEPLTVTTAGSLAFTAGTFGSYSVSASYFDGTDPAAGVPVIYGTALNGLALTGALPAGVTLATTTVGDTVTLTLSGTPTTASAGTYPLSQTVPTDAYISNYGLSINGGPTAPNTISLHTQTQPISLVVTAPLVPVLTGMTPSIVIYGSAATTVTLAGSNFVAGSVVQFNGQPLVTTYVNATQLTAVIPAADLLSAGTDAVTVHSPGANGGTSAAVTFTVAKATPIVTVLAPSGTVVSPITTVTGVNGTKISDGSILYSYYNANGSLITNGVPTAPGNYLVKALFVGDTNYVSASSSLVAFSITAVKQLTAVGSQFTVARGGFVFNARTKTYTQTLTFTNNGPAISGPLSLVLTNLSTGASLANASGTTTASDQFASAGSPYLTLAPTSVAAGGSFTVTLQFSAVSVPVYGIQLLLGGGTL